MSTNKIVIGTKVRSYDFDSRIGILEGERACYVEGIVEGFDEIEGCPRYVIRCTRVVWRGQEEPVGERTHVYPPVNGIPKTFGGVTNTVETL